MKAIQGLASTLLAADLQAARLVGQDHDDLAFIDLLTARTRPADEILLEVGFPNAERAHSLLELLDFSVGNLNRRFHEFSITQSPLER